MKAAILFEMLQIAGAGFLIYFSGLRLIRYVRRRRGAKRQLNPTNE